MATQSFNIYKGLIYTTPTIPKISTIRGSNLKKSEQVWHRNLEYEDYDWTEDAKTNTYWYLTPQEGQMEWYLAEVDRILNGEWIMINGIPTFLNNFCYFFHQWFVTKEGYYPTFKDTSMKYYRFMELVFKDHKCRGGNVMKGRRIGVSSMSISMMLQFALIKQNTEQGICSKTGIDAEKIFKLFLVNSFQSLPPFLKPRSAGNDQPAKVLHITKQAERLTKEKTISSSRSGLNNKIEWRPTSGNVFDGDGLWILLIDEAGKWEEADINAYLPIALKSIVAGSQVGRILMITTVNQADKGGDNYKLVWDDSDQEKRDQLGQTKSKMYQLFIPGYEGFEYFVDKYGNSIVEDPTPEQSAWMANDPRCLDPKMGSKEYCDLQRKNKENDPEAYMEEVRMVPYNPEEVFKSANNRCHFNLKSLNDQIELVENEIKALGRNPKNQDNGRKGYFTRRNNKVVFVDDEKEGLWYILKFLNEAESGLHDWGYGSVRRPCNTGFGAAGLDTFSNAKQTVDKGSDACCIIHQRHNPLDPENSNLPVAMFLGRPATKGTFHNQIYLGLEYYGIKMLAERAPTDWEDYAIKNFLATSLEIKHKEGYLITTKRADGSEVYGVAPQDTQTRETHLTEMIEYAMNNMHKVRFLRLLKDWLNFNIKERTDYDAAMAHGYSLIGLKGDFKPVVVKERTVALYKTYKIKTA